MDEEFKENDLINAQAMHNLRQETTSEKTGVEMYSEGGKTLYTLVYSGLLDLYSVKKIQKINEIIPEKMSEEAKNKLSQCINSKKSIDTLIDNHLPLAKRNEVKQEYFDLIEQYKTELLGGPDEQRELNKKDKFEYFNRIMTAVGHASEVIKHKYEMK